MIFEDYKKACMQFAKDTKDWDCLVSKLHYTTTGDGWEESCDNQSGGIDVSWAFWANRWDPEKDARKFYEQEYEALLRVAEDDEWDEDARENLIRKIFEDMP